jgi:hypothetical protein
VSEVVDVGSTGPKPQPKVAEAAQVTEDAGRGDDITRELERKKT